MKLNIKSLSFVNKSHEKTKIDNKLIQLTN